MQVMSRWSLRYDCCQRCGTTSLPHRANGLCNPCEKARYYATNDAYRERRKEYDRRKYRERVASASHFVCRQVVVDLGPAGTIRGTLVGQQSEDGDELAMVRLNNTRRVVAFPIQFVEDAG